MQPIYIYAAKQTVPESVTFGWLDAETARYMLRASTELARKHTGKPALFYGNAVGCAAAQATGAAFADIVDISEDLLGVHPAWWSLPKFVAYGRQRAPFVQIDTDALPCAPPPQVPVFAQCAEPALGYRNVLPLFRGVPDTLQLHSLTRYRRGVNAGFFGGTDVSPMLRYAERVLSFVREHGESVGERCQTSAHTLNICRLVEQLLPMREFPDIRVWVPGVKEAVSVSGPCPHAMGGAKQEIGWIRSLQRRIQLQYPDIHRLASE
jgi:hypothetical protein